LNLDASYDVIREAVEAAGLECTRADEIQHSGTIDEPMYEQLLEADLVIADLSTYNVNAAYELGVRYGLRKQATIIVAESDFKNPFDFSHIVIRYYEHLGKDIGRQEAKRFSEDLQKAITEILDTGKVDSPVYTFLTRLREPSSPEIATEGKAAIASPTPQDRSKPSVKALMDEAKKAIRNSDFVTAKTMMQAVLSIRPQDPFVIQRMALVTYKSKLPDEKTALLDARDMLAKLDPVTSNDPETLGLWGAVYKRLWQLSKERSELDEAIWALEKGFYLKNDYYNGINLANLLNLRATISEPAEAVADFVIARRIRRRVFDICLALLSGHVPVDEEEYFRKRQEMIGSGDMTEDEKYWLLATVWEAAVGLENEKAIKKWRAETTEASPIAWMLETTKKQIEKLEELLANSPLRFVNEV